MSSKTTVKTYTYTADLTLALCESESALSIQSVREGSSDSSLPSLNLERYFNEPFGSGDHALNYKNINYVAGNLDLGSNGTVPTLYFVVNGMKQFSPTIPDANPKEIISDLLTNAQYGVTNWSSDYIADLTDYSNYCVANGIFLSPALTEQTEAQQLLSDLAQATNSALVWSQGKLKVIPYGDSEATGNGVTYSPDITPIYDLTNNDFLGDNGDDGPIKVTRKINADAYNSVNIEFLDRDNYYNIDTVNAKDQANIELYGLRTKDTITMHYICDRTIAQTVAQLVLQRELYIRNTYEFTVGWKYCLLEPMDIITLTDFSLGLDRKLVRITSVEEDEDGNLQMEAEEMLVGTASAALYDTQASTRTANDYNVDPGSITAPVIFDAPIEATATGLETWIAVCGGEYWGGCNIWASSDGNTYKNIGSLDLASRSGILTADLAADGDDLEIELYNTDLQLLSGSEQDAANLNTLCWVDGEAVAYTTATLTDVGKYTLTGLVRGAYNTVVAAHTTGSNFARLDDNIFKYAFSKDQIGNIIYLKFVSFNVYKGGEQSLSDVDPYAHTLTAQLPPDPSEIVLDENTYLMKDGTVLSDIKVVFNEPSYLKIDHYNIYYDLNDSGIWTYSGTSSSGSYTVKALPQAQTVKVKVTTVNTPLIESSGAISDAYLIIGKDNPPSDVLSLTLTQNELNRAEIILSWPALDTDDNPDVRGYEARVGNSDWDSAIKVANDIIIGTTCAYAATANGHYKFYVKAIDNSGNYSADATSAEITVTIVPDVPTDLTAVQDPKDRSILVISWAASSGKDIAGYDLCFDGTNWDASTKETTYRWTIPASGVYNIMIRSKITAGYVSNVANVSATVSVEPEDVTGFAAAQSTSDRTRITLSWDAPTSLDISYFVIKKGVSWDTGTILAAHVSGTFYDTVIADETTQTFWIKAVSAAGIESQNAVSISGIYGLNPTAVTAIQATQNANDKSELNIMWSGVSDGDLAGYQVKIGQVWESAEELPLTQELYCTYNLTQTGNLKIMIKTVNAAGFYSDEVSIAYYAKVEPLDVTGLIAYQNGEEVELYWDAATEADVTAYEVREGASFEQGALVATGVTQSEYAAEVDTERVYRYHVKAINRSGHYSTNTASISVTVANLPVKNVIETYDEITLQSGIHDNTEFGESLINWSNMGGQFSDYPTTKFSDVGGSTVLKLESLVGFTRASVAYKSDGTEVAINKPRIEDTDYGKVVWVEEATTNLVAIQPTSLSDFSLKSGVSWTNGVYFVDNSSVRFAYYSETLNTLTAYTFSTNIKMDDLGIPVPGAAALSSKDFAFVIAGDLCTSYSITYLGNSIYRVTGIFTTGSSLSSDYYGIVKYTTQSSKGFTVTDNWQLEQKAYPTSFIPTSRAAESLTMSTAGLSVNEGTIEGIVEINDNSKRQEGSGYDNRLFRLTGTSGYIQAYHQGIAAAWYFTVYDGTHGADVKFADDSAMPNDFYYYKMRWSASEAVAEFWNLETQTKAASGTISSPHLLSAFSQLFVGSRDGVNYFLNTRFGKHRLSNIARTDDPDFDNLMPTDEYTTAILGIGTDLTSYPFSGTYSPAQIDVGQVITANITAQFVSTVILKSIGSAILQIRTSQDGSTWTNWAVFKPVQYAFRYAEFQVLLATTDLTKTPEVNQFTIRVDVPDTDIAKTATIAAGGATVSYGHTYYTVPVVTPMAVGEDLHAQLISKTISDCVIKIKNSSDTDVGGQADIRVKGY
jgi:hypothetical protein